MIEPDNDDSGCLGLVGGIARNPQTSRDFPAATCTSADGPFICRECFSDAVVRKCTEKRDHFAHIARLSPVAGAGESARHARCKNEILAAMQSTYPHGNWAVEREIPANAKLGTPLLVPDVSGRVGETRVAVEVQASTLTLPKLVRRSQDYSKRRIALVWVVPLTRELETLPMRPRLYERYLHSMYFGRIYYWWDGMGASVVPVHMGVASRHIEHREWYEDGELQTAGGFDAVYKTIKSPLFGRRVSLGPDFLSELRPEFTPENERKRVPELVLWRDNLAPWWVALS